MKKKRANPIKNDIEKYETDSKIIIENITKQIHEIDNIKIEARKVRNIIKRNSDYS
jgi:hypothetical protein